MLVSHPADDVRVLEHRLCPLWNDSPCLQYKLRIDFSSDIRIVPVSSARLGDLLEHSLSRRLSCLSGMVTSTYSEERFAPKNSPNILGPPILCYR